VSTLYPGVSVWFYLLYVEGFITKHSFVLQSQILTQSLSLCFHLHSESRTCGKRKKERRARNTTVVIRYTCYLGACGCCSEAWIFVCVGGSLHWSALFCLEFGAREGGGFMVGGSV